MKKLLLTLAILLFGFTNQSTKAATLTFDDYTTQQKASIITPYGGLNWGVNTLVVDAMDYFNGDINGYTNGIVSPKYVAVNSGSYDITITSGSLFTFNGAYLTGAWRDGLNVTVEGYNGSSLLFNKTVITSAYNPTWFNFDYVDVDKLVFHSFGGEEVPTSGTSFNGSGAHFAMDNFTINEIPAPEPTTMFLGLMSIAGAAGLRRKK